MAEVACQTRALRKTQGLGLFLPAGLALTSVGKQLCGHPGIVNNRVGMSQAQNANQLCNTCPGTRNPRQLPTDGAEENQLNCYSPGQASPEVGSRALRHYEIKMSQVRVSQHPCSLKPKRFTSRLEGCTTETIVLKQHTFGSSISQGPVHEPSN